MQVTQPAHAGPGTEQMREEPGLPWLTSQPTSPSCIDVSPGSSQGVVTGREGVCVCVCVCDRETEREPTRPHDAFPTLSCLLPSFLQWNLPVSSRDLPHLCPKPWPHLPPRPQSTLLLSLTVSFQCPHFRFQQWPPHVPTSGPLHWLFLQPGMLFLQVSTCSLPQPLQVFTQSPQ